MVDAQPWGHRPYGLAPSVQHHRAQLQLVLLPLVQSRQGRVQGS